MSAVRTRVTQNLFKKRGGKGVDRKDRKLATKLELRGRNKTPEGH